MSNKTNLTIDSELHDRLAQAKGSMDTWDEFLSRLLNASKEGQMHLNRATLSEFDQGEIGMNVRASETGALQIEFLDSDGQTLGETTLSMLEPEQEVTLKLREGSQADD